jgi:hypothetical protein
MSALVACLAMASAAAFAAPRVSGSSDAVNINTQNSSVKDVLFALSQKFRLQLQSSANLDKQVTGIYRGSLLRVVSRLLEGYNYIIKSDQDRIEVTVLGTKNGPVGSAPSNTVSVSGGIAVSPGAGTNSAPAQTTAPLATPLPGILAPRDQSQNSPPAHAQSLG